MIIEKKRKWSRSLVFCYARFEGRQRRKSVILFPFIVTYREREPLNPKQNISYHPLCFSKIVFARWGRSRAYEKPMERSRIPPPSVSLRSTANSRSDLNAPPLLLAMFWLYMIDSCFLIFWSCYTCIGSRYCDRQGNESCRVSSERTSCS